MGLVLLGMEGDLTGGRDTWLTRFFFIFLSRVGFFTGVLGGFRTGGMNALSLSSAPLSKLPSRKGLSKAGGLSNTGGGLSKLEAGRSKFDAGL